MCSLHNGMTATHFCGLLRLFDLIWRSFRQYFARYYLVNCHAFHLVQVVLNSVV